MLFKFLHKHLRILFMFIIVFILVPFLFWGMSSYTRNGDKEEDSALPTGKKISRAKFSQLFNDGRISLIINIVEANNVSWEQFGLYQNWINQLLKNKDQKLLALEQLMLQEETSKYGITTSKKEVVNWLETFPLFQRNGQFDIQLYKTLLANVFNTWPTRFEESLIRILNVQKLQNLISNSVFVSEDEVFLSFKERNEKTVIYYIDFDTINYIAKTGKIDKKELENYYNKYKEEFREPEKIKIAYILFTPETVKKQADVTLSEIEDYYEEHKNEFKDENNKIQEFDNIKDKINEILINERAQDIALNLALDTSVMLTEEKRLGDMRTLAKEKGLDIKETGFISKNQLIPELGWAPQLIQTVWDMDIESISNLINIGNKWVIASPIEKKPSQIPELTEIEAQVTERLKREKAEELAYMEAEEIFKKLPKNLPFTMAAKSIGLHIKKSKPLTRQNPLGKAAFFNIPPPIKTSTGYSIYAVREFDLADPKKWEEEKKEFIKAYLQQKKNRFLKNWIETLLTPPFSNK